MNKKKYITTGIFVTVFLVGGGIAYYFYPSAIDSILGINSVQNGAVADADLSALDNASSSVDAGVGAGDVASSAIASVSDILPSPGFAKKSTKKKNSIATSAAVAAHADPSQEQTIISSSSQDTASDANVVAVDDGLDATVTNTSASSQSQQPSLCSFPVGAPSTTREVIFNEIAWMGSPSSSVTEWIEIKNSSADVIDLSGWGIANASGKMKISFSTDDKIAPGGLLLLSRGSAGAASGGISSAKIYSGTLANAGDTLVLMDAHCAVSDYLDASSGWPGGNNTTKQTLERDAGGAGWHTSALPGGTPGVENSAGPPTTQYKLTIAFQGDAAGATITSNPAGLVCGASCVGSFASGTRITLTPAAGPHATFSGWSGLCYGETMCSFVITANVSIAAQFNSILSVPVVSVNSGAVAAVLAADVVAASVTTSSTALSSASDNTSNVAAASTTTTTASLASGAAAADHVLIAAVQIAGAEASNDLVKLYNPTASSIDMSGWKLHKKSQTGTDYSLKVLPAGSMIAAGQLFVWANSTDGFSDTVDANVSSTETLAADNSVALMDAAGTIVDAVAWGTGSSQYGEGPPYPTSPGANQLLSRRSSGGVMVDTKNNTNDFTIQ